MLVATYKYKKDLKAAKGKPLLYIETSIFGYEYKKDGHFAVVGPGAYNRKWYAKVWMKDGLIEEVE